MENTGISYTVKDWFANKIANEVRRNIMMCDVFCILKETDKAIYAVLNCGYKCRKTTWIPKSVLVANAVGEEAGGIYHHETKRSDSYDEAIEALEIFWNSYA